MYHEINYVKGLFIMERVPLTLNGLKRLEVELKTLKTMERPAVIAALEEAKFHGDLSENAEYHAARDRQSFVEGRIIELEDKISRAQVIDVKTLSGDTVKFGATVTVKDDETNETFRYQIVGADEADIKQGLLSITAPLARALIGKPHDAMIEVKTPKGEKNYQILKIEFI